MAGIEGGVSAALVGVGLEASSPLHITPKPTPFPSGNGHYRVSRRLVPAATTLAGILWTFRNPTASGLVMTVKRCRLRALQVGAPTAAIEDQFLAKVARGYTVADATGSVSIAPAAGMQKLKTSGMGSATAQLREANIAAGASGGTKTEDTDPFTIGSVWVLAAISSSFGSALEVFDYDPDEGDGEFPATFAADEGFVIRNANNFGAASGIVLLLDLYWVETTLV
jgi:hypothetical protein